MAANKFATMLHRNTNKITVILVYALLEWALIVLLLLNSLFSYLIVKYAEYFGLKKPCLWCSRLDHIFDSSKKKDSYRDLVCDDHAKEISKLGFCLDHHTLSESKDMCEGCSSSSHREFSKDYAFFPWMKQIGLVQNGEDGAQNSEVESKCSCCGADMERKFFSPYVLFKPSWEVLDYPQKENLMAEDGDDDRFDKSRSDSLTNQVEDVHKIDEDMGILIEERELEIEENFSTNENEKVGVVFEKVQEISSIKEEAFLNASMEDPSCDESKNQANPESVIKHLEFYIDGEDCHLIPIELMDPLTAELKSGYKVREQGKGNGENEDVILEFTMNDVGTEVELVMENEENRLSSEEAIASLSAQESQEQTKAKVLELVEEEDEWSSFIQAEVGDSIKDGHEEAAVAQTPQDDAEASGEVAGRDAELESDFNQVSDDALPMQSDEIDSEISIGTEIPEHEPIDDIQNERDFFASSSELHVDNDDNGFKQAEDDNLEFKTITIETSEEATMINHLSIPSEVNEIEEEKVPDTPTSVDSLHQLHKKLLLLDRRESGTDESLDGGSVLSDIDSGDGVMTVEKLKSALRVERKALNALYAELEEERSASAEAANHTMAMINRLQEEKAAMQMEAFQYQRMMEEQSEYDQEALQLLNELMIKREREKAEIEIELELYRKKVQEYEAKEKTMMLRRRSRISSASCSNADDSDGLSIDLNLDAKEEESPENNQESNNQNTPADAVLYLEESLANFEDEKLSILEQLKVLEEKLFMLNSMEEQHFEDIKSIDQFHKENGNGYTEDYDFEGATNGLANGYFKEMNGKLHYQERKVTGAKAKRLLPLFDAIHTETEDGILNGHELEFDSVTLQNSSITKFELDIKRLALEEEVDYVHERLQALEADREFLKHCISSLRKGDKGVNLLQEILQHLRDLRSIEQRARNIENLTS